MVNEGMRIMLIMLLWMVLVLAPLSASAADRMLGVTTGEGVPEEMDQADVAAFLGTIFTLDGIFDGGKRIDGANNGSNAFLLGNGTNEWAGYHDVTKGLLWNCKMAGVENACNYVRQLAAGFYWEIQNHAGTSLLRVTNDTGEVTNAKINTESAGNVFIYKKYLWRPFAACQSGAASTVWDLPTSNAPTAACKGTNTPKGVLEFPDGSTDLSAHLVEFLNEDWTGAIEATLVWESASTSTNNALWGIAIACAGAGDSSDPAYTDDDFTADANNGTANTYNLTAANTVTTTGSCTAGDLMHIRVKRRLSQAGDTLAATAQAVGLSLKLREAQ